MQVESDVMIGVSDGAKMAVRIYRPEGQGPFPTLFAASPYRYDNDGMPKTGMFLWHETGPIEWYIEQGYAYVHMDTRGSGKSEGRFGLYSARERRDYFEVIEWIARQSWSSGKIGGIGHSYYATAQWCMAAERPPHLTCIAPYDGHIDAYEWCHSVGIPSKFPGEWWDNIVRPINRHPAGGATPREIDVDLVGEIARHPARDAFWEERNIRAALAKVDIPVYSIGVWVKRELHLLGNIAGFDLVKGPKKLLVSDAPTMFAAQDEFDSIAFHEKTLLPFYDHYLKGKATEYTSRPQIEARVLGEKKTLTPPQWPPQTRAHALHLSADKSGVTASLNDGSLTSAPPAQSAQIAFTYPDPHWKIGPVAFGPKGPDTLSRILSFTSAPLEADLLVAGACELDLQLSTTRTDTDVIVRLAELPADGGAARIVTKGWLRASHRHLAALKDASRSPEPLTPGERYRLTVKLADVAYRLGAGARLRLEIANADSAITDAVFAHIYTPDMIGTDTYHLSADAPPMLRLPILD